MKKRMSFRLSLIGPAILLILLAWGYAQDDDGGMNVATVALYGGIDDGIDAKDLDDDYDDDVFSDDDTVTYDPDIPLCQEWQMNPEELEDPVNIHCMIEKGSFSTHPEPDVILRVADWNIERGHHVDEIIDQFLNHPDLSETDVIFIQEADRHCTRTQYRNITREMAEALGMDYVYAVEFVELNQGRGEHGNAILSRYPIIDQAVLRHTDYEKWYEDAGEPRLGGRISIKATIDTGQKIIQVASVHYIRGIRYYFRAHNAQTQETIDFLDNSSGLTIFGGDLNTGLYYLFEWEPSIMLTLQSGFEDALDHLSHDESYTHPNDRPLLCSRLDWIFSRGIHAVDGRVLTEEPLNALSDHLCIIADFR